MSESEKQEIVAYASPSKAVVIVGIVVILLAPVAYFIAIAIKKDQFFSITLAVSMALVGVLFFSLRFWYGANVKKHLKEMERNSSSRKIYHDFRNGTKILGERMIVGERYLFCKGMGVAVDLQEIAEIRCETKGIKFIPMTEELTVRLNNRDKLTLCSMDYSSRSQYQIRMMADAIAKRSPDAEIKYK